MLPAIRAGIPASLGAFGTVAAIHTVGYLAGSLLAAVFIRMEPCARRTSTIAHVVVAAALVASAFATSVLALTLTPWSFEGYRSRCRDRDRRLARTRRTAEGSADTDVHCRLVDLVRPRPYLLLTLAYVTFALAYFAHATFIAVALRSLGLSTFSVAAVWTAYGVAGYVGAAAVGVYAAGAVLAFVDGLLQDRLPRRSRVTAPSRNGDCRKYTGRCIAERRAYCIKHGALQRQGVT